MEVIPLVAFLAIEGPDLLVVPFYIYLSVKEII